MTAPIDNEPVFGFGAPVPAGGAAPGGAGGPVIGVAARSEGDDGVRAGAHAQPVEVPAVEVPRLPYGDRRRYFLSSLEPSGDFDAVIVAVTDGTRRRYFTTRDGARLTEIDVAAFDRRNEGGERSLLELDERELGELEAELRFVRPVRGRDPIAEVAEVDEADDEAAAESPAAAQAGVAVEPPDRVTPHSEVEPPHAVLDRADADDAGHEQTRFPDEAVPEGAVLLDTASLDEPQISADPPPHPEEVQPVLDPMDPATEATPIEPPAVDPMTEEFEEMVASARRSTFREAPHETSVDVEPDIDAPDVDAEPVAEAGAISADADEISDPIAQSAPVPTHAHTLRPAPDTHPSPMSQADALEQVALAKGIAFIAHRGQLDRSGLPYIDHPGRISERFDPATEPIEAASAWLHDVLEDTAITPEELFEAGVRPEIIEIVRLLTRSSEVPPEEYYARIRSHPAARRVKLADIDDNTARWRLRRLDYDVQLRLIEKYRLARRALGSH
ncbi:hypothetical protein BCL57_001504 [Agromyces flavus]|uniref:HD domain-containing protein n=1 Tax=Agromyces flavus TaxID=589382 RepID=A0ABT1KLG4_9MICO|nr:hypothetical protein [Agromyces flavus]MCP2367350.1 hypothetical protein [Agromyces flavus]GGI45902.1 hypothetical protein GCM10010932_11910 [Agromyces flavus]